MTTLLEMFVCWVKTGIIEAVNLLVVGVGAAVAGLFALLPNMPAQPPVPADVQNALASADYYVPLTFTISLIGTVVGLITVIWLVRIPLRWVRAQ